MDLPASVKVEKVGFAAKGLESAPIEWAMGKNEVAILLAVRFVADFMKDAADDVNIRWVLDRKSDFVPDNLLLANTYMNTHFVAGGGMVAVLVTEGGLFNRTSEDFVFPYPLIMVRPSQFHVEVSGEVTVYCGAYLYYLTQRVSDEQLAGLLVKNHA